MLPLLRLSLALLITSLISACVSLQGEVSNSSGTAPYYESYSDRNRAPASLSPPAVSSDDETKLDPLYMRTQADYHYSVGEALSLEGHRQKAIESFKMTLLYDANSSAVRLRLAAEYLKAGMVSEAIEQAQEVTKREPKNIEARLLLGGLYSTMKLYDKAVTEYDQVLKLDPKNAEAPLYLGAVFSEQKQPEKAIRYFESLAKLPDYATPHLVHYYIGRVRLDQKGLKYEREAEKSFKKCMDLKPSYADCVISLSSLYSRQKKEKESVNILVEFQKNQGPNARVAEILAQYYLESSEYDLAYEQLEYLEGSDDALSVKLKMALILIEKKIYDKATAKLEEILAEASESDKIRFYLGAVYEETKQDQKAIAQYNKIPDESRFYPDALVHSAYLMKNSGKMEEALSMLEKAIKNKKTQPQIFSMYASLLEENGNAPKALTVMTSAVKQHPDEAQVQFYYGTLLDKAGDKKLVVPTMREVLRLNPNHVQGMNYLAYTWADQGENLEEAESMARKALKLEPKDGYIMDTLGWVLFKRGRFDEAAKVLEAAFKTQPSVSVIAEHLGDVYSKKTLTERAINMYNKALNLESDPKRAEEIKAKITSIDQQRVLGRVPARTDD
jgi:tetratricopeptide (TPR) repeat protein